MIRDTRLGLAIGIATILVLGSASIAQAQYQAPPPGYAAPPGYYAPPPRYAYPPPPPPPLRYRYRDGLTFGGGIGVGGISASDCPACGSGLGWELHIGGMVNPRFAILADLSGVVTSYDDINGNANTLTNSLFAVAAQCWLADILWLKAGLGDAHIELTTTDYTGYAYNGGSESALGVLLAGGVEVLSASTFAIDLQLRYMHGFYSGDGATNWSFLVGFNWY